MSKYLPINLFIRQALLYPLTSPFLPPVGKVEEDYSYAAGKLIGTLAGGGGIPRTGQTTVYTVNDDGTYQKGLTIERPQIEASRYQDNLDNTITDLATGLMWIKDIQVAGAPFNAAMTWTNGILACEALSHAGHGDWRMPNIKEFMSLINYSGTSPASAGVWNWYNTSGTYWTSTTSKVGPPNVWAWYVLLTTGAPTYNAKTGARFIVPVRLGTP